MSTSSLYQKISGILAGFGLVTTCLLSSGCTEFPRNLATVADKSHPRYPSVVVTTPKETDVLEFDLDIPRKSDTLFWQDVKTLEEKALIWRVNLWDHFDGSLIGEFMDWTDISNRKKTHQGLPKGRLLRVEIDFCTTKDPHDAKADCDGRQINILLLEYPSAVAQVP